MTYLENFIEILQTAPVERTACFIAHNFDYCCRWCNFFKNGKCSAEADQSEAMYIICEEGIKQYLESEVK